MSTTPARQPAGVPTGGQFAAKSNPECDVDLGGPLCWGADLDAAVQDGIRGLTRRWLGDEVPDRSTAGDGSDYGTYVLLEVLDIDEDEAIRRYGAARGAWLGRLEVNIQSSSRRSPAVSSGLLAGPDEEETTGTVEVWDADAEYGTAVLASSRFSSDDDPEIGGLLERYAAAAGS
jgi:hypothetical protein